MGNSPWEKENTSGHHYKQSVQLQRLARMLEFFVKFIIYTFQRSNNKGAGQTALAGLCICCLHAT